MHFPKLQHHWNLTIRLVSVIPPPRREVVGLFYSPSQLGKQESTHYNIFLKNVQLSPVHFIANYFGNISAYLLNDFLNNTDQSPAEQPRLAVTQKLEKDN